MSAFTKFKARTAEERNTKTKRNHLWKTISHSLSSPKKVLLTPHKCLVLQKFLMLFMPRNSFTYSRFDILRDAW